MAGIVIFVVVAAVVDNETVTAGREKGQFRFKPATNPRLCWPRNTVCIMMTKAVLAEARGTFESQTNYV